MTIVKKMNLFDIRKLLEIGSSCHFDAIFLLSTYSQFFSYFQKRRYAVRHVN